MIIKSLFINRFLKANFFFALVFLTNLVHAELDPAEIAHGERLFLETRFAENFYQFTKNGGDYNSPIDMLNTVTSGGRILYSYNKENINMNCSTVEI